MYSSQQIDSCAKQGMRERTAEEPEKGLKEHVLEEGHPGADLLVRQ